VSPRDLTPAELLSVLLPLAVAALAMVYAMVQWSTALLEAEPPATSRRTRLWGAVYAGLWAVLVALFLRLFLLADGGLRPGAVGWLALFVGGWWTLHGLILWFGRTLQRANAQAAAAALEQPATDAETEPATGETEPEAEEVEPPVTRRRARRKPPRLVRRIVAWAVMIGLVLVAMVLGELPPLQALERWTEANETPLAAAVGGLAALGFALFMGSIIHMLLTDGRPMTRGDVEELVRRSRISPGALWSAGAYRIRGKAIGARAEGQVSFAELKAAWRARAWRYSTRWRRVFLMVTGALTMVFGILGLFVVVGPAWVKVLVGGAVVSTAVMLVQGFRQA